MEIKDIINEGRPVEPYSFETDNEVTWYKIGANDGYAYALEEFENNRLKACDNQTPEQAWRESEFVVPFVKEHHRTPTFSDAIEETRKQMIDKACEWIKQHLYDEAYLFRDNEGTWVDADSLISGLKKTMEE